MNDHEAPAKDLLAQARRILDNQYDDHSDFNAFLDEVEPLTVPSPRPEVESYRYERSKALFWLDREAYDDELAAWENDTQQAQAGHRTDPGARPDSAVSGPAHGGRTRPGRAVYRCGFV